MYNYDYYDYSYGYQQAATGFAGLAIFGVIMWLVCLGIGVFTLVCMWKLFTKAGKPGWAAIVPIYNIIVMLEITELPMWYIALFFVPFANIYAMFKIYIEFAKKYGKTVGFGVGMVFLSPIFLGILAFGKDTVYQGVVANPQPQMYQQPVQPEPMMQPVQPEPMVQPVQPEPMMQPVQPEPMVQPVQPEPMMQPVQPEPMVQPVQPEPMVQPVQPEPIVQPVQPEPMAQPVQPQFCTKCGAPTLPGSKFCVKCGNQL